jgi:hypothetical protein
LYRTITPAVGWLRQEMTISASPHSHLEASQAIVLRSLCVKLIFVILLSIGGARAND